MSRFLHLFSIYSISSILPYLLVGILWFLFVVLKELAGIHHPQLIKHLAQIVPPWPLLSTHWALVGTPYILVGVSKNISGVPKYCMGYQNNVVVNQTYYNEHQYSTGVSQSYTIGNTARHKGHLQLVCINQKLNCELHKIFCVVSNKSKFYLSFI